MTNKSYAKKTDHCPPVVYNAAYWKNNSINNASDDFVWNNIEKPIIDSITADKNVWWTIGERNKYFPQLEIYSLSRFEQLIHIITHILIWIGISYLFYNRYPILCITFSVLGLLTHIMYDFLKGSNFYFFQIYSILHLCILYVLLYFFCRNMIMAFNKPSLFFC